MVVSTWNKGWRQPQSVQGSKANKDTFLCLAMLRQTQGKVCVWLHHMPSAGQKSQDCPCLALKPSKLIYWLELFSSMMHKRFAQM